MEKDNNQELFKGAACYYANYRRGYSKNFYNHITKVFNLNKESRILDLGTGTGQIAIPLSKRVKEVVAVDINSEMLAQGRAEAEEKKIFNIVWTKSRAEDISNKLGFFNITTMGASFHWMQQDKVLDKVYSITKENGGVVIISNISSIYRNRGKDVWKDVVLETIKEFLGEERRAGSGYFKEKKDKYKDILARSKFTVLKEFKDEYTQEWSIDQIIGFLYSTSYAARRFFGDKIKEFEDELRKKLLVLDKTGQFTETAVLEAFIGKK